jgi:hypothetical protein
MSNDQRSWTLDNSFRASNPGHVPVSAFRWSRHYPTWPLLWFSALAALVAMVCFVDSNLWLVTVLLLCGNWLYWRRVREHFWNGDAIPGIIVSMKPLLIAVATDLSKGSGEYPVVKIIKKSLTTVCGQIPDVGSQLAAVAVYASRNHRLPHWDDLDPRPIDCATGDVEVIDRVMTSLTENDWNRLHSGLRQVPQPYRCGLFHIETAA